MYNHIDYRFKNTFRRDTLGTAEVREPKQKRSIEKKNKIIKAGYELFCEKGYHNTNTAEIAKAAGVSTGIVYNYFRDKKDIFLSSVNIYFTQMIAPVYEMLQQVSNSNDLENILDQFIDSLMRAHTITFIAHEEMLAMAHSDHAVAELFLKKEEEVVNHLVKIIMNSALPTTNPMEKVRIAFSMVENLCHESVYFRREGIDYDAMKRIVINSIIYMLTT